MGNIVFIGPRDSGKTTYLAALAYWSKLKKNLKKNPIFQVRPLNDEAMILQEKAQNIICQGSDLPPTPVQGGVDELPIYTFQFVVSRRFKKAEHINLGVRDYPGGIFDYSLDAGVMKPERKEFFQECFLEDVAGCLILLDQWERRFDIEYAQFLTRFTNLMNFHNRSKNFRLAVAMSKCERGELWTSRVEPEIDIFSRYLRKTKLVLSESVPAPNLHFFAVSTFGVLSKYDPRPNRIANPSNCRISVLRDVDQWQPYNLIAPIYWLSTGKVLRGSVY